MSGNEIECCESKAEYGANSPGIDYRDSLPRYIRITDIKDDGRLNQDGKVSVALEGNEKYVLNEGDFLFARSGATAGKTYLYHEEDGWAIYAGYLIKFRINKNVLLPAYLEHYTQTNRYWFWVKNTIRAGAQPNINAQEYSSLPIPLPSLSEQRKIAAILGTWDEAITLTEKLIRAKQRRKKALMQQLLTGKVRFGEFEGEWCETQLNEFLQMKLRKVEKPSVSYGALGVLSHGKGTFTKEVEEPEKVMMTHLYKIKGEDLIVSITFAWEGAIALVKPEDEGRLVSHRFPTYTFNRKKCEAHFFKYLMLSKRFFYDLRLISPGGAGRNRVMSKKDFLKLKVTLPPIEEQRRIAAVLQTCDAEIELWQQKLALLRRQKKGLMQQMLTGKVRVEG